MKKSILLPLAVLLVVYFLWDGAVLLSQSDIFPRPSQVFFGIVELIQRGLLLKYVVASLFRVSVGFVLAVLIGVPLGLLLGWFRLAFLAFNPLIQILRPISPIAWIPIAILWFKVDDRAPIFLIFLSSLFPITVTAIAAVQNIQPVYVRAAQNFGVTRIDLKWGYSQRN
jgi:NitT/TauT family transport system permease protein